ncbi:hypothetical protein DICPUDRAFT_58874 [Dictyostelium purpureum]|uniref:Acyl-coenzyme A oxidase n=1 Tax=Dictyostelium purpureum TaxID=5786 RepID=F1A3A8_DICPU|nr:uncharacterized protein DICPUDRAFT_58874 [Dictyostelium purpureum]EGC29318.1 hypothetical protein DICPUDRAFT_58874 [Dictyostelium purpureum]|eukprot:XP_003294150.1 hypothetical protein DICPUDRAFT_58874 [Dictyostelium purpureum]
MESAIRRIQQISNSFILQTNNVSNIDPQFIEAQNSFNPQALYRFLFPYEPELRSRLAEVWKTDKLLLKDSFGLSLEGEREQSFIQFKRLMEVLRQNFSLYDLERNPRKLAVFTQSYRFVNISVTTLIGVHFSLFGASILFLGSNEQREKYIKKIETLEVVGCFSLTELGHGSNVQQIETIAEYDHNTQEFIINSPTITSQKYFIGGAAKNASHTIIMAQLKVAGKMEGVHAFVARIRNEDGSVVKGIRISDCGVKMGLNGVDNGRLMFDCLRLPRENLLSRFGGVNKAGIYSSPINPANKRFAQTIGALVLGRYLIAIGSVAFNSVGLTTALRYSFSRKQFSGSDPKQEKQLISYSSHRKRLLPHLANTYAIHFSNNYLLDLLCEKEKKDKEIHILASALKAYGSWSSRDCLQECREACGGQGFLSENLIGNFKSETEIYTTFEGDNILLYQQVAKFVLSESRKNPPPEYEAPSDSIKQKTDSQFLRSFEFLQNALNARFAQSVAYVTEKLSESVAEGKPIMDSWNDNSPFIVKLGQVYTEKIILRKFIEGISGYSDEKAQAALQLLVSLYTLNIIEKDPWFLKYGYISSEQAEAITVQVLEICKELVPHCISLTDALGFDNETLGPIANDWISKNKF